MSHLNIGATPCDEPCAQVGSENYQQIARQECERYKAQLTRMFPKGRFRIKTFPHDFGGYLEVVAMLGTDEEIKAAYEAEAHGPRFWDEPPKESAKEPAKPFTIGAVLNSQAKAKEEQEYADSLEMDELESMILGSGSVCCADGCEVEPDGRCPHGYCSPLLVLGLI